MARTMKQKRTTDHASRQGCIARINRREARNWKKDYR